MAVYNHHSVLKKQSAEQQKCGQQSRGSEALGIVGQSPEDPRCREQCSSSGSIDGKVQWEPILWKWGATVTRTPGNISQHSQNLQSWGENLITGILGSYISCVQGPVGILGSKGYRCSLVVMKSSRFLLFPFSPWSEIPLGGIFLGAKLLWTSGWGKAGKQLPMLFYAVILRFCALQGFRCYFIAVQSFQRAVFCCSVTLHVLFLWRS